MSEIHDLEPAEILALRLAGMTDDRERLLEELERSEDACHTLARTLAIFVRTANAARIDAVRGDHAGALEWLLQGLEGILELDPWDGLETGSQWLTRTATEEVP